MQDIIEAGLADPTGIVPRTLERHLSGWLGLLLARTEGPGAPGERGQPPKAVVPGDPPSVAAAGVVAAWATANM